jgi:flagellar motor switch/type III secretory pathway protein FliN
MNVRPLTWRPRAQVAVAEIASAANAIVERVRTLLRVDARCEMYPPVVLDGAVWERIVENARTFAIAGARRDAVLVFALQDAKRIVARAFEEEAPRGDALSMLEERVLASFARELEPALEALCGPSRAVGPALPLRAEEYVEIRIVAPIDAAIGIGLGPAAPHTGGRFLSPAALEECALDCSARLGVATVDFFTLARLGIGDVLRLDAKVGPSATLNLGSNPIALGEGGISAGHTAFLVHKLTHESI